MILVFLKDYTSASLSKFQISIKTCPKPKTEKKYRVARNVVTFTILTFFKSGQVIFSYMSLNVFLHNKNVMKTSPISSSPPTTCFDDSQPMLEVFELFRDVDQSHWLPHKDHFPYQKATTQF